jgi:hypothetical protein
MERGRRPRACLASTHSGGLRGSARRALRPGREELAGLGRRRDFLPTESRKRGPRPKIAVVERREASALRHSARHARSVEWIGAPRGAPSPSHRVGGAWETKAPASL